MAPPAIIPTNNVNIPTEAPASTCTDSNVNNPTSPAISGNNDLSVLMTSLQELRKLMKESRQLIEALQAMKYANNTADKLELVMNACANSDFLGDPYPPRSNPKMPKIVSWNANGIKTKIYEFAIETDAFTNEL
ncbi:hypothetical protein AVEN_255345-1 [Araneus ventricosus]|uniref:Uncharacterized protein n=1 Tax=Araneus ventricosus TaxID=182803 RepID=A0A4Y2GZI3_ARAVE|nr:hypothetical protein AVEN_255345-1 [Araneus ventricosus]